jgi:hypothetical protein
MRVQTFNLNAHPDADPVPESCIFAKEIIFIYIFWMIRIYFSTILSLTIFITEE